MTKAKLFTLFLAAALAMPVLSAAQSASGTLAVSATVQSSISMVFNNDINGVALTGSGSNAATLDFGNISAYGTLSPKVGRSVGASSFTVSTPFDVLVSMANSSSADYTLKAQLNSADALNTWALNSTTITNAAQATLASNGSYGSSAMYTLALTVPFSSSASSISNTINFVASAN
ncbi:MAG: hypothetical protein ACRD3E_12300 [Terriglobales bacterium]